MRDERNARDQAKLRNGYTTGTCAAACVRAAAGLLLSGRSEPVLRLVTPSGTAVFLSPETELLGAGAACGRVRKDAGDDPDVTDGAEIRALVFKNPPENKRFWYQDPAYPGLFLTGGRGVGLVTRPGLACPVGAPAINPVPRQMIFAAAQAARREAGRPDCPLYLVIAVPAGAALAAKTFNPRLGICGGISILGTSGIVKPMSEEALVETIRLDVRVRAAAGKRYLAVVPGNYGTAFLRENAGLSEEELIRCGNFFGDTMRILGEETIEGALVAGHIGKLVKVAGGVLNTHSRFGDRRMEILAGLAGEAGADERLRRLLLAQNTAEEAAETLQKAGALDGTAALLAERAAQALRAAGKIPVEVMVFSSRLGLLAETPGAREMMRRL